MRRQVNDRCPSESPDEAAEMIRPRLIKKILCGPSGAAGLIAPFSKKGRGVGDGLPMPRPVDAGGSRP